MSDSTFVPIGSSVEVVSAINKDLGLLVDGNLATYRLDSDSEWRLLHVRCSRTAETQWAFSLENAKLTDLQKIYDEDAPEYDPPRIMDFQGRVVVNNPSAPNAGIDPPNFRGPFSWGEEPSPESSYLYPHLVKIEDGSSQPLSLRTEWNYHVTSVQEVGTYILPIAYHRNTGGGVEVVQIARSDLSFWPMPPHAVWSRFEKIVGLEGGTELPP